MDPTHQQQHIPPPGEGPAALTRMVQRDAEGKLTEEIACRGCGYNLRGLPVEGRCPECGTSVGWSIHGDLLRYSDPAWVRHLADGMLWIIIAIFLSIATTMFGDTFDQFFGHSIISTLAGTVGGVVGVVGYWKVTMLDPGKSASTALVTLPRATRWLAVAGVLAGPAMFAGELSGQTMNAVMVLSIAGFVVFSLASVVAALLLFILLRRLARRIPNDSLAKQTGIVMWGTISCYATFVLGGGVIALLLAASMGGGGGAGGGGGMTMAGGAAAGLGIVIGLLACVGVILLIGFVIWWIVLLFLYRGALSRAADTALQTWMRQDVEAPPAG